MITFVTGNIFDSHAMALVNPVNTVGVMGKGLALEFKRRFPINYDFYWEACHAGEVRTGEIFAVGELADNEWGKCFIFNFPTKTHWREKSSYAHIESGLRDLRRLLILNKLSSVAIPALGCGLGELNWTIVKQLMLEKLANLDVDITIYEPHNV